VTVRLARGLIAAIIVPAAAVAGCLTTSPRVDGGPALIVAYPAGLTQVPLDGSQPRVIVPATHDGTPRLPAVSPDGTRIAYLLGPPFGTPGPDSAADVWLADRDGAHRRKLLSHPQPNHSFRQVAWQDDEHVLVVADVPAQCDGCNAQTTTDQRLERVDITSGDVQALRDGVPEFGLSPDARWVAFPTPGNDRAEGLQIAPMNDGQSPQIVVPREAFAQITSPRYAPGGKTIAFAAAQSRSLRADVTLAGYAPGPLADGLPQDLWMVDADGTHLRIVAALRENAPVIAWDSGGSTIYAVGAVALYRIDVASGAVTRIGRGGPAASLTYARAEH
jgi:Tol biopolymer transport system component